MLVDARFVTEGSELTADLCVVGSGPAGIAIVERLRGSGLSICLVESGGLEPELATQRLYHGSNVGHRYYRLDACRFRLFGGTTNRWGGWCRPLEPIDFERREWLPWSGWPIGCQALEPYYPETARLFRLSEPSFDLATWRQRLPAPYVLDGDDFQSVIFQLCPRTNFAEGLGAGILAAQNVTTLLHANVTGIELDPGTNRLGGLRVQALGRRPFVIRPKAAVLATGGIENARLLLASRADRTEGLGNEHDLVGRFFMEHLHVPAGHLVGAPRRPSQRFYRREAYGGATVLGTIVPTARAQQRHRSPSASISIERLSYSFGTPYVGWPPSVTFGPIRLYRALRRRDACLTPFTKELLEKAYGFGRRWSTLQASCAALARTGSPAAADPRRIRSLYFRAEQTPNPASRVSLGDRRDACGVPEARLDWRVAACDTQSILTWLTALGTTFARSGVGGVVMPAPGWEAAIIGGPHHIGTTRMSAGPKTGVVDEHCRVHSVENLYVAGSSVFVTGGYANPTFTLVALALRLADRLRERLR